MAYSPENNINTISKITIEKNGEGVLAALVREAKRYGVLFTRGELARLGNQVCASIIDPSKSQKSNDQCTVQLGQVIQLSIKKTPTETIDTSGLVNGVGMVQKIDEKGKKSYYYTTGSDIGTFPKG